ncbi:MAG: site-2 protease family protein [Planctomycetales bacterium]|nr:site-2 protease family protein [Planctomycetales bacterium]
MAIGGTFLLWTRVALGIGLVIFVHELGHFVAAKTFGVKCEKFYVGFDPPMKFGPIKLPSSLGKFTYGETEYGIGIIPLGGYVKMLGQDDDPRKMKDEAARARQLQSADDEDQLDDEVSDAPAAELAELDPRSLPAKPVWQRMIIMSAGVFMNVVTGAIFAAIAFFYGVPYTPTIVGSSVPGGPAWQAGVVPGGQVVEIAGVIDEKMRFRDMKTEVLQSGFEDSEQRLPVALRYGDDVVRYQLPMMSAPGESDNRLIGVGMAFTTTLGKSEVAVKKTVADQTLVEADKGAEIVSFNGTAIDTSAAVPSLPFLDYLYSHPTDPVELVLRRTDKSEHTVTINPQKSRWVGIRVAPGAVKALVADGAAEKAGLKVGDVIQSIDGVEQLNVGSLLLRLAKETPVDLTVKRGEQTLSLSITPTDALQTSEPTDTVQRLAAINAYGFAFEILPTVASFDSSNLVEGEPIEPTDVIQTITMLPDNQFSDEYDKEPLSQVVTGLSKPWKISDENTSWGFVESIQKLPVGTRFKILSERAGSGKIVESVVKITDDPDQVRFDRGIALEPYSYTRVATSAGEAMTLGIRESKTRLGDVFRFLKMAVRGRISAKMVGGPIRIFQVAGYEAERGVSTQLLFLTMLSMNLAILNFLPIPILDGGHMVFLLCEAIMGRRVNEEVEMRLTLVGAVMLLALMVFVLFNDLFNIVT